MWKEQALVLWVLEQERPVGPPTPVAVRGRRWSPAAAALSGFAVNSAEGSILGRGWVGSHQRAKRSTGRRGSWLGSTHWYWAHRAARRPQEPLSGSALRGSLRAIAVDPTLRRLRAAVFSSPLGLPDSPAVARRAFVAHDIVWSPELRSDSFRPT